MNKYRYIKADGAIQLEHRYLMEKYLGRKLNRNEHIHHINGDKSDNRLENLVVMSARKHTRMHKAKHPLTKECVVCGKIFTPSPTKRERAKVCSDSCKTRYDKMNAEKRKKPIRQLDLSGNLVKEWDSARDVQRTLGFQETAINACLHGRKKTYKGCKWEYANDRRKA